MCAQSHAKAAGSQLSFKLAVRGVQTTAGWSKRAFIAGLSGFDDPNRLDQYINASSTVGAVERA